jgi:hypothetical protein
MRRRDYGWEIALRFILGLCCIWALAFLLTSDCHAYTRSDVARCEALWPAIETAADLAGMPESIMFGLLLHESRCLPVEGLTHDVTGTGQVSWPHWRWLLGPEGWRDSDLLDPWQGALMAGRVLEQLRILFPTRTIDQILCLYSSGGIALDWDDCRYSRAVMAASKEAR